MIRSWEAKIYIGLIILMVLGISYYILYYNEFSGWLAENHHKTPYIITVNSNGSSEIEPTQYLSEVELLYIKQGFIILFKSDFDDQGSIFNYFSIVETTDGKQSTYRIVFSNSKPTITGGNLIKWQNYHIIFDTHLVHWWPVPNSTLYIPKGTAATIRTFRSTKIAIKTPAKPNRSELL